MIPDYFEAITAYRCWNVYPNGLLIGQAHAEPWPPYQAFVGRCGYAASPDHVKDGAWMSPPVLSCDCGVHALKAAKDAEQRILKELEQSMGFFSVRFFGEREPPKGRVWGAVKLWGRIVEHEIGYRAEFAYPSALICEDEALAATVSTLYGVPCEVKRLQRPKPKKDYYDDIISIYQYYGTGPGFISSGPQASFITPTPKLPPQPGLIQSPSLANIAALGASPYQKRTAQEAALRAAHQQNWRDVMKKAFHVTKDAVSGREGGEA